MGTDEKLKLSKLGEFSISQDSLRIVREYGIDNIIRLVASNTLFDNCREEIHRWLDSEPDVKRRIEEIVTSCYLDCDGDIDIMVESIPYSEIMPIIEEERHKIPNMLQAIFNVASDESPFNFNNYSFIGVLFDYLREINYYVTCAGLA